MKHVQMVGAAPDSAGASGDNDREQRDLVDQSRMTLSNFLGDPNMTRFLDHIKDARGLFAGLSLKRAALISRDEWSRIYYGRAVR